MIGKALILAAALAAAPGVAQPTSSASSSYEGRITEVQGDVVVYDAAHPQGAAPADGMPLKDGDRVVTGDDGLARIVLDGQSAISLAHKSDFTLTSLDRSKAGFSLAFGTILAKIKTLLASEAMQVRTPTAVAAIRGTELGVHAEAGGDTRVGVFDEGRVEVSGKEGSPQVVTAGQETMIAPGRAPARPVQLFFFKAYRRTMRAVTSHLAKEGKRWRSLAPQKRQTVREERFKARQRQLERRQERRGERRGR